MRSLLVIILFLGFVASVMAQSPHGADLKIDCASCHSSAGWEIDANYWRNRTLVNPQAGTSKQWFDHEKTRFDLKGQHAVVDCKSCHESLVFSEVSSNCIACHTDVHQQSVGVDCARCHSSANWLVDNITELHQQNGFPLFGNHAVVDCNACHRSETALRFDRIGNQCVDCHLDNYAATKNPNHQAAGYSTNCVECHDAAGRDWFWTAGGANHLFFPLTKGHQIDDCTKCHIGGNFVNTPTDCFACHEMDFRATTSPDHETGNFPTDCRACHSTDPGWNATDFTQHDQSYFPIFSGRHEGEWNQCTECHTTAGDFKAFSCIQCHEHNNAGNLANEHDEVSGYSYTSSACYNCHPKGN
jgi:hypothetical protein